jgi:hypothetical protein
MSYKLSLYLAKISASYPTLTRSKAFKCDTIHPIFNSIDNKMKTTHIQSLQINSIHRETSASYPYTSHQQSAIFFSPTSQQTNHIHIGSYKSLLNPIQAIHQQNTCPKDRCSDQTPRNDGMTVEYRLVPCNRDNSDPWYKATIEGL